MAIVLGDSFKEFEDYGITQYHIEVAYSSPIKFEDLVDGTRLYLKSFENQDEKRNLLLIGTQNIQGKDLLAFSFWIPSFYENSKTRLIDLLDVFVNQFGLSTGQKLET